MHKHLLRSIILAPRFLLGCVVIQALVILYLWVDRFRQQPLPAAIQIHAASLPNGKSIQPRSAPLRTRPPALIGNILAHDKDYDMASGWADSLDSEPARAAALEKIRPAKDGAK